MKRWIHSSVDNSSDRSKLMQLVPREYKNLVVDIYEGDKEWDDETHRWYQVVVVEWVNGETSRFAKDKMRINLKEFHGPDEYSL